MRRYRSNSPHAAARVVALTLLADGTVSRGELGTLMRVDSYARLGLDAVEMQILLEDFARDLFACGTTAWDHKGALHPLIVRCVLEDVTDAQLQQEVMEICRAVARSDCHLSDGEEAVLDLASLYWRMPGESTFQKGMS